MSPFPFACRMCFGTGRRVRPVRSRQTLVGHVLPSTVASTDMRPHPSVADGASSAGTGAKVQPPFPSIRNSVAENSTSYDILKVAGHAEVADGAD